MSENFMTNKPCDCVGDGCCLSMLSGRHGVYCKKSSDGNQPATAEHVAATVGAPAQSISASNCPDLSATEEAAFKAGWISCRENTDYTGDVVMSCEDALAAYRQSKAGSVK